ncbi:MAG: S8 family serine peptidase [Chloroflexota bacterium]|nr:S8 family serine peptidase [Chloroflexota bacterium]
MAHLVRYRLIRRAFVALILLTAVLPSTSATSRAATLAATGAAGRTATAANPQSAIRNPQSAVLVQLCAGVGPAVLEPWRVAWGWESEEPLDDAGLYRLRAARGTRDVAGAVRALTALPGVAYAEAEGRLQTMLVPNDTLYPRQWHLPQISAPAAWDYTTGSRSIIVAMIDTGVAADHPDLAGQLVAGYNFVADTANSSDDNGHGTYTSGLVAALFNNGVGVAGVAPHVRVMPVKILDKDGGGNVGDFARGIHFAVDHGARVINISAGIEYPSTSMQEAVHYAHEHNVVVVASAGNTPDGTPRYPGGFAEAIAVAATDRDDHAATFSSYGPFVDLAAPGVDVLSTSWSTDHLGYEWASGTSSAAPLVAGAAALLLSLRPDLSADDVQRILEDNSDDLGPTGWDPHYGAGRLNLRRALAAIAPSPTPAPPSVTPAPPTATHTALATVDPPTATPAPTILPAGLTLTPNHGLLGATLSLSGRGYAPGEAVGLRMTGPEGQNHELGTGQADSAGHFSTSIRIPATLGAGIGTLFALGARSNALAATPVIVDLAGTTPGPTASPGLATGARIEGTISGLPLTGVQVYLQVGNGVRDFQYGSTDPTGFYHFDNLSAGSYTVGLNSRDGSLVPAPVSLELDGQPGTVRVVNFGPAGTTLPTTTAETAPAATAQPSVLPTLAPSPADPAAPFAAVGDPAQPVVTYFAAVRHTLRGPFLAYWQAHGGLPLFGYPISEEFTEVSATDGLPYRVQYFQRNRFEYHPENAPPYAVLLGLLGRDLTADRLFPPASAGSSDATHLYFVQTGHRLGGAFLAYWQAHGGLPIFGYPISEEFAESSPTDGQTYTVQYFERNRFELHPENPAPYTVLLGLLGVDLARRHSAIP